MGLVGIFFYVFYMDMQLVKEKLEKLSNSDTELKSRSVTSQYQLNVWAGENFGLVCNLFGGSYLFSPPRCSYIRKMEDGSKKTEEIRYTPPFPDLKLP